MRSEWKECTLGDIVKTVIDYRGKTPKKLGGDWSNSGYRALSAKNIKTGKLVNADAIRYVNEDLYKKWMKDEIEREDIIITSEAPFGQVFYWNSDEKIVLSQRLFAIRLKKEICAQFVYYYMTGIEFQGELASRATGTTVVGLRQPELLKCKLKLPDLDTQRKIAAVLSSLDDKIELNNAINRNLEQQAQALFKNAIEHDGSTTCRLSEIAELNPKRALRKTENARYIDMTRISAVTPFPDGWSFKPYNGGMKFKNGDTLMARITPCLENGKAAFINFLNDGEIAFGSTEYIVISTQGQYIPEFFYCLSKYAPFVDYAIKNRNGSSGRQRISAEVLGDFVLPVLTDNELEEFNSLAPSIFGTIKSNAFENRRLASLRDALLPRLMSGEIDLTNA